MAVARAFVPRLMPCPEAAAYLGVSLEVFCFLDLHPKLLGRKRLYDVYELDVIDEDDVLKACSDLQITRAFGGAPRIPDITKFPDRENFIRRPIRKAVRDAVMARDGEVCRYCRTTNGPWHLDHVLPASRGGESTVENLVVACISCNLSKRDMTPDEWLGLSRTESDQGGSQDVDQE